VAFHPFFVLSNSKSLVYSETSPSGVVFKMASAYRLFREARVIATKDGAKPDIVTIPEGSTIIVPELPTPTGLVPVQWQSMTVKMFAEDLKHRAERLD